MVIRTIIVQTPTLQNCYCACGQITKFSRSHGRNRVRVSCWLIELDFIIKEIFELTGIPYIPIDFMAIFNLIMLKTKM